MVKVAELVPTQVSGPERIGLYSQSGDGDGRALVRIRDKPYLGPEDTQ